MLTRGLCSAAMLVTAAGTLASCNLFTGPTCTMEARPAIRVDVRDSLTNALIGDGSRIIAREGTYADTAEVAAPLEGPYTLAFERAGTYTVTVEKDGYQLWSRSGVRVTRDECHVRTVTLTARLKR